MFRTPLLALISFGLTVAPSVNAWGALGHEVVAFIAQDFVSSSTASFVQKILGSSNSTYMASVSTWADSFRATSAGSWSAPMHFIDANDNPPTSCNVNTSRDCGTFCVVEAINNYTNLLGASSTSTAVRLDAVRFVIHFIGDIHQPLHDEAFALGGNDIDVKFGSSSTNLHAVWDTSIPTTLASGTTITVARTYATTLTNAIKTGSLGWSPTSWTKGLSLSNPLSTALGWAQEANAFVCSDVVPDGFDAVEGEDLSGAYFTDHSHAARIQLARAGYRLAAWLNLIATGTTGGL